MFGWIAILVLAPCVVGYIDKLKFPEYPVYYEDYNKQCHIPVRCGNDYTCPNMFDWKYLQQWAQLAGSNSFERDSAFANSPCYLINEEEYDFGMFASKSLDADQEIAVKNTITTELLLQNVAKASECAVRNLMERRCPLNNTSLSLDQCLHRRLYKCDPEYPYRSYDGVCNNLKHATWGQAGNPLKLEIAPCFDDFVSKYRKSSTGKTLPNTRQLIKEIQIARNSQPPLPIPSNLFNIFGVLFSEVMLTDYVGRAMKRVRDSTMGFRGCRADGHRVSNFQAPITAPLRVFPDDPHYGRFDTECLNFTPLENANDYCELQYPTKRNLGTSYLDLSSTYGTGTGNYDNDGKIKMSHCKASSNFDANHILTIQFLAIAGLFSQLHNYCMDATRSCDQPKPIYEAREKCRAMTIGAYQRIIYEELLHKLFGSDFYNKCGLNCTYDEDLESSVSSSYTNGPGRFQHVWIPENFTLVKDKVRTSIPMNVFFRNFDTYDCTSVLDGMLDDPIRIGALSDSIVDLFFTTNNVSGHCLSCLDLERNRNAGLCPLVVYKHFYDQQVRNTTRCYNTFEDLNDVFADEIIEVFKKHFETPSDIDLMFSVYEKDRPPGSSMPIMVSTATCMQFKILKCSDRFFYSWNKFLTPAQLELIHIFDMKTVLAHFSGIEKIPLHPFRINSERVPAEDLRKVVENKRELFCNM